MSVPVGSSNAVWVGARVSLLSLFYGFLQFFYILLQPSFSEDGTRRQVLCVRRPLACPCD